MDVECCIQTIEEALIANKYDVKRIEVCSALSMGGLTPSFGLIKECSAINSPETHVLIRPRPGGFNYGKKEIEIMMEDIRETAMQKAKGVVFGVLNMENEIDVSQNLKLIELSKSLGLEVTFHRAFDYTKHPETGLETVIELGFDRLLTSGHQDKAIDGLNGIRKLIQRSKGRIQIMAGGGVDKANAVAIASAGVDALHFSIGKKSENDLPLGMGVEIIPDEGKIRSILSEIDDGMD